MVKGLITRMFYRIGLVNARVTRLLSGPSMLTVIHNAFPQSATEIDSAEARLTTSMVLSIHLTSYRALCQLTVSLYEQSDATFPRTILALEPEPTFCSHPYEWRAIVVSPNAVRSGRPMPTTQTKRPDGHDDGPSPLWPSNPELPRIEDI